MQGHDTVPTASRLATTAAEPLLKDVDADADAELAAADACCPACLGAADSSQQESSPSRLLACSPSRGNWSRREHRRLGLFSVMMIIFFNVSGGPLGSEEVVRYGGPLVGLSSLALFACVYSVPQAMLTAELSTAFPDNGGYSLWAKAAFGDFWGVQESYWSWFSGVVDSALYPVLLYSAADQLFSSLSAGHAHESECAAHPAYANVSSVAPIGPSSHHLDHPPPAPPVAVAPAANDNLWLCLLSGPDGAGGGCAAQLGWRLLILLIFTLPNLLSSKLVGHAMVGVGVFTMLPFVVMSAWGLRVFDASRLLATPPKGVRWGKLLGVVFWSLEGFDSASTFAGEVNDPSRTYPRALGLAVVLMLGAYLVPLGVGAAADPEWHCWRDGSLSHVARLIGGPWLGGWVLLSALVSNWGLFASELLEDSYQLLGMAQVGLAPKAFGRRSRRFHTPVNAILLQLAIIAVLVGLDFDAILCVDNFFSASSVTLEFAAGVQLRRTHPHLPRPYRMPFGTAGLALFFVPPIAINLYVMWLTAADSTMAAALIGASVAAGLLLYAPFVAGWKDPSTLSVSRLPSDADGVSRIPTDDMESPYYAGCSRRPSDEVRASRASADDGAANGTTPERGAGGGAGSSPRRPEVTGPR